MSSTTDPPLPRGSSRSTLRSIFIAACLCWSVAAVGVSTAMAVHALSHASPSSSLQTAGLLSVGFAVATSLQAFLAYRKLRQSLVRYVRFGLTSAAFSRTSARDAIAWVLTTLAGLALYIAALTEYLTASNSSTPSESSAARQGVVWFAILGALMGSLVVGMLVVSRISPWLSTFFITTPLIEEDDQDR